jgi:Tfp pilus assembly protein PilO
MRLRGADKTIFAALAVFGLALAFYFLILAPKRERAAELNDQISALHDSVDSQNAAADAGEQTRRDFPKYYGKLVVLGKAVPSEADTASMIVQLNSIAHRTDTSFRGLTLSQTGSVTSTSSATTAPAPAPATGTSTASTSTTSTTSTAAPAATSAAVPATETAAANLPIGATIGAGGLPTLPYQLTFQGTFFNVADFIGGVNSLVQIDDKTNGIAANGRLFTVDGFALEGGAPGSDPKLDADFLITTYVTPPDQGVSLGASPTGPAPTTATSTSTTSASQAVAK